MEGSPRPDPKEKPNSSTEAMKTDCPSLLGYLIDHNNGSVLQCSPLFRSIFEITPSELKKLSVAALVSRIASPEKPIPVLETIVEYSRLLKKHRSAHENYLVMSHSFYAKAVRLGEIQIIENVCASKISSNGKLITRHEMHLAPYLPSFCIGSSYLINQMTGDIVSESHPQHESNPLSPRENEVLELLLAGESNQEVAERLSLSVLTVQTHRKNIKKKLNISGPLDMVRKALCLGFTM